MTELRLRRATEGKGPQSENCFSTEPPPRTFLRAGIRAVCPGLGGGRTKPLGINVEEFVWAMGQGAEVWARTDEDSWVCKVAPMDGVVGWTSPMYYFFREVEDPEGSLLLSRVMCNGRELSLRDVIYLGYLVSINLGQLKSGHRTTQSTAVSAAA